MSRPQFGEQRPSLRAGRRAMAAQQSGPSSQFSILNSQFGRSAFSLVELMIAIVILGLGLLVVATMFPIAWTKAREVSEFTTATACTDAAEASVRLLTRVSKVVTVAGAPVYVSSSFVGDGLDLDADGMADNRDPWVHALELGNISADAGWGAAPPPPEIGDFQSFSGTGRNPDPEAIHPSIAYGTGPFARTVEIAFQDRVYPPLPPSPVATTPAPMVAQWQALLGQRRFCWSVLHKLNYDYDPTTPPATPPAPPLPSLNATRTLTLYLVTLRRGQATRRYARQDPGFAFAGTPIVPPFVSPEPIGPLPTTAVVPRALNATEDVQFPVPWRVQIEIVDSTPLVATTIGPAGVPSVALANDSAGSSASNRLVAEMMPRGAYLIDERNGLIYRVARRDYNLAAPGEAVLTFEQEIPPESLDVDGDYYALGGGLLPAELLRTVWVFPPAVEKQRAARGMPIFDGPQPVAAIELRTVALSP
ncbi:MAG: prepilin-type N-terminal cleavage/methylation domain-containing protein [bacterium]|nr:prepilin-type N-terminal cleavage/methylation domain-containing protein [bacterium]